MKSATSRMIMSVSALALYAHAAVAKTNQYAVMMDIQTTLPKTGCYTKAGLVAGTTTTLSTGGTITYQIRGKAYTKTAITNGTTPTTDYATGLAFVGVKANQGCVFLLGFDSSGNLKCVQGSIQPLDTSGNFINAPLWGPIPDNFCPIGYLVIQAGSTANNTTGWVFGTNNQAGVTGITYTLVDVLSLPDRPQVS